MTDRLFKITPTPPTKIEVLQGQEGKLSFTIESLAAPDRAYDALFQPLLVGDGDKAQAADWLVPKPERVAGLVGGKTLTAAVIAHPTASIPPGVYGVKLVIADAERPNDTYAESPVVTCEVRAPEVRRELGRPFRWWLVAIIAGGVLLVVGAAVLVYKLASGPAHAPGGLDDPCDPGAGSGACDEGLVCAAEARRCLLGGGAACKPEAAAQCASGECSADAHVCAVPLGDPCDPAEHDTVPCLQSSTCDPTARRCLGNVGAACRAPTDCATGRCESGACALDTPAVKPGDPCTDTCPEPLQCSATTRRCVEQVGRPCSANNQCATGLCQQNVCTQPQLRRDCTADGICGPDQKCLEFQPGLKRCVWQPGHSCGNSADCSSRWCNHNVCSRDDGGCQTQDDCPPPYQCVLAKKRCQKPLGQPCAGNAECDSGTCKNNVCAASPPCVLKCRFGFTCAVVGGVQKCVQNRIWEVPWKLPIPLISR